jgi:hypothetical protein
MKTYKDELRRVYGEIERTSTLFWSSHDSIYTKSRRSQVKEEDKQINAKWKKDTKAQFGYGEITMVSI